MRAIAEVQIGVKRFKEDINKNDKTVCGGKHDGKECK